MFDFDYTAVLASRYSFFFFSSRRRHTRFKCDWSSDVCSSDLVIGVLQLINAQDRESGEIVQFSADDQQLLESLASQAAIALTNRRLIVQLEELFEAFIQLINTAIDDKSPYTGGHCARVPALTMMLAEAVNRPGRGPVRG